MKKLLAVLFISLLTVSSVGTTVMAAPKTLANGIVFDPVFYAATYPDVAAVFGNNEKLLEEHFLICGIREGRIGSMPGTVAEATPFVSAPVVNMPVTNVASGYEEGKEVLNIVNAERAKLGLPALQWDDKMAEVANLRAREIATSFSHTRPDGSSCFTAFPSNYSSLAENIAAGQPNPAAVMNSWMNSTGHRNNILSTNNDKLGVGVYETNGQKYWVQCFIRYR